MLKKLRIVSIRQHTNMQNNVHRSQGDTEFRRNASFCMSAIVLFIFARKKFVFVNNRKEILYDFDYSDKNCPVFIAIKNRFYLDN
jgi:hypothetical protein